MERHRASPVTVQRALRALADEGLVDSRPGAGTFVRAHRQVRPSDHAWQTSALRAPPARARPVPQTMRHSPNDVIALHSGYPDRELLPERLVRGALARAARGAAAVSRPPVAGLPDLQAWFAHQLAERTPAGLNAPSPGDVVILPGSQSGLASLFRGLVGAGRPLLVESPTYWGAIAAAEQAGVQVVPVAGGREGLDPDDLDRAFRESRARLCYAQPTYANPTGAQWPGPLRERVLDVVRRHGAFLVEDDWAHDFGIDTEAVPLATQDDGGHVVYLRSLTKSVSPALRVAAVVARGPARERVLADRGAESLYVSAVLQAAALDVVTQPAWGTHLRALRRQLRARRDLLVAALREHAPAVSVEHVPAGGLHLWVRLPDGVDSDALVRECEHQGLLVVSGREWFPAEPTAPYVRLNFSGPDPGAFARGARILGEAVDRARG